MRILLLGKNGQVGWELQRALGVLGEVVALDRHRADTAYGELAGDLSDVLRTVFATWLAAGSAVPHTVTHVTIGVNSPSENLR